MAFWNSCWTITHCTLGPLNVMDMEVYNLIMFMHLRIHDWLCSLNLGPFSMYNNCSLFLNSCWTITHCTLGPLNAIDVEVYNLIMCIHLRIHDWLCSLYLGPFCMYNNYSLYLGSIKCNGWWSLKFDNVHALKDTWLIVHLEFRALVYV